MPRGGQIENVWAALILLQDPVDGTHCKTDCFVSSSPDFLIYCYFTAVIGDDSLVWTGEWACYCLLQSALKIKLTSLVSCERALKEQVVFVLFGLHYQALAASIYKKTYFSLDRNLILPALDWLIHCFVFI